MAQGSNRRGNLIITLGILLLVLFALLATLNAFNLNFLNPASLAQTLVFVALSVLCFLLFVGVLVLLVRNVLKLYADQRSRVLGTRLRTRMLWGAVLVSLVPLTFMFAFSYLLMNRAADRWFSQPVTEMRDDADRLAEELFSLRAAANARSEADAIAAQLSDSYIGTTVPALSPQREQAQKVLMDHAIGLQGGFVLIYSGTAADAQVVAALNVPHSEKGTTQITSLQPPDSASDESPSGQPAFVTTRLPGNTEQAILQAAERNDDPFYTINGADYTLAASGLKNGGTVVAALPIPSGISSTTMRLRKSADAYWIVFRERRQVRGLYTVLLLLTTALALFAICWLSLNLSKQVTRPLESLADAMEAIAAGGLCASSRAVRNR